MTLEEQIKETEKQIWVSQRVGTDEEIYYFECILESLNKLKDLEV